MPSGPRGPESLRSEVPSGPRVPESLRSEVPSGLRVPESLHSEEPSAPQARATAHSSVRFSCSVRFARGRIGPAGVTRRAPTGRSRMETGFRRSAPRVHQSVPARECPACWGGSAPEPPGYDPSRFWATPGHGQPEVRSHSDGG